MWNQKIIKYNTHKNKILCPYLFTGCSYAYVDTKNGFYNLKNIEIDRL